MQLGFSAWAMAERPVEKQIAIVQEAGYSGVELVSGPTGSLDALRTDADERRRIRQLLDDAHLALPSIAGHGNLLQSDLEKRATQLERLHANVDLCADLAGAEGPPCMVTMAYGRPNQYEEIRETVAENMAALAEYGRERGVIVALEPHVGQAFDLPEKVLWLLERVGSPHFRLNFDNSHFEVMGRGIDEYVPLLTRYAVHTHVKDQRGIAPNYEFLIPGEGDFDYAHYLGAMQRAGYSGFVTVEISKQVQNPPDYDPAATAARSFDTLLAAAERAGVAFDAHRATAGTRV